MAAEFGNLQPAAAAELARQIETLEMSAAKLVEQGFGWQLASELVRAAETGEPDMMKLRALGVDAKAAIDICTAIASRHAEVKARLAALPAPEPPTQLNLNCYVPPPRVVGKPDAPRSVLVAPNVAIRSAPVEPAPAVVEDPNAIDQFSALRALHTLAESVRLERACPTELHWAGFSVATAEELARCINASRSI